MFLMEVYNKAELIPDAGNKGMDQATLDHGKG